MSADAELREAVRRRAGFRCEYCRFPERFAELRFQLDHVVARQHGGETSADNLAWACLRCNKRKGPNLSAVDPLTAEVVPLFNPRTDRWHEHFSWQGARLIGLSPVGRATVQLLQVNSPEVTLTRQALIEEGVYGSEPADQE